ncbi:MAG: DDE-type integrase/transposase/recombinase [Haliea sp.]
MRSGRNDFTLPGIIPTGDGTLTKYEVGRRKNNRCENSHLPFRRREQAMLQFRCMGSLQKFVSIHSSVHNHFNHERHLNNRETFKLHRIAALAEWQQLRAA